MHEESLVRSLLKQVEAIALQHDAAEVTEIEVEIGPLSGVEPLLVESAFERVSPDTSCRNSRLQISFVPLQEVCGECSTNFETRDLIFQCPACSSHQVHVTGGDTFRLMNVTLQT